MGRNVLTRGRFLQHFHPFCFMGCDLGVCRAGKRGSTCKSFLLYRLGTFRAIGVQALEGMEVEVLLATGHFRSKIRKGNIPV